MYLSNQLFYTTYLSKISANHLFPFMEMIDELFVQYGIYKLKHPKTLETIKKNSPTLFTLISLLINHRKLNKKDIKEIKNLIDQQAEEKQLHFTIQSPNERFNTAVEKTLKEYYNTAEIETKQTSKIGVKIEGDGYSYKRTLEKDLEKIFQNLI